MKKVSGFLVVSAIAISFSAISVWAAGNSLDDSDNTQSILDHGGGHGGGGWPGDHHGGGGGWPGDHHGGGGGWPGDHHGGGGGWPGDHHGGGGGWPGDHHGGGGGWPGDHHWPNHPPQYPPGHGYPHDPWPVHGGYPWPHWPHPEFPRPYYDWRWDYVRAVTCTSADNFGDLFPVTETGYFGWEYQERMWEIEDAAIDRCYNETGGDESCYLVGCEAYY